jgi:amidophosphoribosyltransferase
MCGIVGIVGQSPVNQRIYDALTVLQHRGQDAAGIMTEREGELCVRKDVGLVRDVFQQRHMMQLAGNVGIGHVRYPTAGCDRADEAQPFYVNSPFGIGLAHNGNLTNVAALSEDLVHGDRRHLNTSSDSEVLLNVFASELQKCSGGRLSPQDIFGALEALFRRCQGGFAVVSLIVGHGVVGFRDVHGIRPLVLGRRDTPRGPEWMLASESVALDFLGFRLVRDVNPGEAVYVDDQARLFTHQCGPVERHTPCIFEYVYFARPDSIIDNISVHKARMRMGERLAEKVRRLRPDHDIDGVIPIPDTSRTSAMQLSAGPSSCRARRCDKNRFAASSTPSTSNFAAATCCWSTTRSCAARPPRRSSRSRAKRGPARSILPRLRHRSAIPMCTASTCRLHPSSLLPVARKRRSRASLAPTGSSTRT